MSIPQRNVAAMHYVYVLRSHEYIVDNLKKGHYGGVQFVSCDTPPGPRKYRHFIMRSIPRDEDFSLLHENLGEKRKHVHKLIRISTKKQATTSVRLIWKSDKEDPPMEFPLYPDMESGYHQ